MYCSSVKLHYQQVLREEYYVVLASVTVMRLLPVLLQAFNAIRS
jgi:hypothetical protein